MRRLGSDVIAVYTCGGIVGRLLEELVSREGIESRAVQVATETREDFTVHEEESGQQFRFVLAGPEVTEPEWQGCLNAVCSLAPFARYLVASGSLPPGVPVETAFRYAMAAGSTALLQPGTELCHGADVKRLFHQVVLQRGLPDQLGNRSPASPIEEPAFVAEAFGKGAP